MIGAAAKCVPWFYRKLVGYSFLVIGVDSLVPINRDRVIRLAFRDIAFKCLRGQIYYSFLFSVHRRKRALAIILTLARRSRLTGRRNMNRPPDLSFFDEWQQEWHYYGRSRYRRSMGTARACSS